jgi:hypothetical protein
MAGVSRSDRGSCTGVRSGSNAVSDAAAAKEASWQTRLRRFRRSGQTVAEYCAAEGISTASFYQWRRRLAERRPPKPDVAGRASAFQAVRVTGVVSAISVHLPDGARIDVPAEQLDALRAVVEELRRGSFAASTEGSSC